ncbi:MAG: GGDEF domain-containing protein [Steroidobacteraceae bacterium]
MLEPLKNKLSLASNFPTPPAIALQIVSLAGDPDIDVGKVAATLARDPGLTAKVLRVANSPLYSKRRKSENLRQALVALGLNAATTLALSFSLVSAYKSGTGAGINYVRYWRRAILGASAARTLGALMGVRAPEDIFLAALLQDIAVLGVDRVQPDFYRPLPAEATHGEIAAHEISLLGTDHAALGGWLLRQWKLPEALCATVEASHDPETAAESVGIAARCVALGSECVEMLLAHPQSLNLQPLAAHAQAWLGIDGEVLTQAISNLVAEIPEIERLFDTSILEIEVANAILDQAREILTIRNLQAIDQMSSLRETADRLEARTTALEDKQRRDPLTGVFNRGFLDETLHREFCNAVDGGWALSIVFADLDRFKQVNDTHGHPTGDSVLIETARVFISAVRDTDVVARYGGEEFVIVLPGLAGDDAMVVADRILMKLRCARHQVAGGSIRVTASLGLATLDGTSRFKRVSDLIEAADRCVYAAKRAGRDRVVCFNPRAAGTSAAG